jgi:glycosyltransferase involved in cell wall biosynthesis
VRRVLMVSPHFPPDGSAASHRVRLLAPHLAAAGWKPTVVTVTPDAYESTLDPALAAMVPASLDVVRCRPWNAEWTRAVGIGDLGLRAFDALRRTCAGLLARERYDVLFVTVYPVYPALLGPMLKRRFPVRFVLDYQDPWVGNWGLTVGGGPNGTPDFKSRASRRLGKMLEPIAVRAADAITAVSPATYEDVLARIPVTPVCRALPLGWERSDLDAAAATNPFFSAADGNINLAYVGTLLPTGFGTLEALLAATRLLRDREPALYARLRLWFIGTSNQSRDDVEPRVLPIARRMNVDEVVREIPSRVGYTQALAVLRDAAGILLLGSRERHYTASKLYPALMAMRPLLAVYHQASTVVDVLRRAGGAPSLRLVTYSDADPGVAPSAEAVYAPLRDLVAQPIYDAGAVNLSAVEHVSARTLAHELAAVMDQICGN